MKFLFRYVQSSFQNFILSQRKITSNKDRNILTIVSRYRASPSASGSNVPALLHVFIFFSQDANSNNLTCFVSIQTQNPRLLPSRTRVRAGTRRLRRFENRNEEFVTISVQVRGYNIVAEEKLTESCQRENPSSFSRGRDIAEKCFAMMNTTDGILRCTFLKWFSLNTSFFCKHHSSLFAINFYIKNLHHKYFNIRYISCKHF